MTNPNEIYDLLQDYASNPAKVREVIFGLVWTWCEADAAGLAMSPGLTTRTLPWSGTLRGRPLSELAGWLREFDPYRSTIGMAAVNAALNQFRLLPESLTLEPPFGAGGNLAVFEHFLPQIRNRRTVVVGRYPGLDRFIREHRLDVTVLERQPGPDDLPDAACEYLLPEAEWVFITASSIPNKTFPRLAQLSRGAVTVLMGPTTPWLPELYHFGVDYLAGIEIVDAERLRAILAEGGGVRIFDGALRYRIARLSVHEATDWSRQLISRTLLEKENLTQAMADWYEQGHRQRYPDLPRLEGVNRRLSRLDTCFKRLWDERPDESKRSDAHE